MKTRLISEAHMRQLISMQDVIDAVEKTFVGYAQGTVLNPTKVTLDMGETSDYPPYGSYLNAMPAFIGWSDLAGLKWVGGFDQRKAAGRPLINGMIFLADPKQGDFLAVMNGTYVTAVRTGAQNAVGIKHCLKGRRSVTLGLLGAGLQGHMQTWALSEVMDITQVKVYDVSRDASERYKAAMQEKVKGDILIVDHPRDICNTDVIICCTISRTPVIEDSWVRPGTLLCPIGSYQELDDRLVLSADKIIVDHFGQCSRRGLLANLAQAGLIKESDIFATLGELCLGTKEIGDISAQRVISCPIGMGALDVAVASVVYQKAVEQGVGGEFDFS